MDKQDKQIGEQMRRIVGQNGVRFPVMSGVVKSVDDGAMLCEVALTAGDDNAPTDGVLLNVKVNNTGGMYMLPTVGADCIVAEVDGPGQLKQLLWASAYDKVYVTAASLIQLNDGSLGGLVVLQKALDNLNAIKDYVETMNTAIGVAFAAVLAGSSADGTLGQTSYNMAMAGQNIDFEDMENTKIKQG